jgi:hypothetical protein
MSSGADDPSAGGGRRPEVSSYDYDEERGFGWIVFSGVMIMIVGILNFIYGIAAIDESKFYIGNTKFVITDLKTWGWIITIIGGIQILVGAGIWARSQAARWVGVFVASLNAVAQLLFIAGNPWLSLALFAIDILVIYGLICYGGRMEEP